MYSKMRKFLYFSLVYESQHLLQYIFCILKKTGLVSMESLEIICSELGMVYCNYLGSPFMDSSRYRARRSMSKTKEKG